MPKNGVLSLRCECEFTGYFSAWLLENVNIHRNAGSDVICIFYMCCTRSHNTAKYTIINDSNPGIDPFKNCVTNRHRYCTITELLAKSVGIYM